jgi:multidrug resistance efflux pump
MSEQDQENTQVAKTEKAAMDPVRKWTFIVMGICVVLFMWYLRSDRVTPYTSQARVHALVVPIAPEVSGTVASVSVSNNQQVEAGQELFQVDTNRFELAVQTAEANLDSARQATGASSANVDVARAGVTAAQANLVRTDQDAKRMRAIREEDPGAVSLRRLESAEASLAAAAAQVRSAEANVEKAIQDLGSEGEENSRILQAQAALDQAMLDLERTTVRAPEDGVVTGVRLDKGNFAAAGAPQMTFIATHNIWVQADFTENNLGNINGGDSVEIVFDALPGRVFKGTVRDMGFGVAVDTAALGSLPSIDNNKNWLRDAQRFPVLVNFEVPIQEGGGKLKVGSQAGVVVYTDDHWIMNTLARFIIRINSYLSYVY